MKYQIEYLEENKGTIALDIWACTQESYSGTTHKG